MPSNLEECLECGYPLKLIENGPLKGVWVCDCPLFELTHYRLPYTTHTPFSPPAPHTQPSVDTPNTSAAKLFVDLPTDKSS